MRYILRILRLVLGSISARVREMVGQVMILAAAPTQGYLSTLPPAAVLSM
jgi:hypothetical protein